MGMGVIRPLVIVKELDLIDLRKTFGLKHNDLGQLNTRGLRLKAASFLIDELRAKREPLQG